MDIRVDLEDETIVYFKIVAEDGTESEVYSIKLTDMSSDNSLKEVYVDGVSVKKNSEGKYETTVLDTTEEVLVKAVSTSELAKVRVAFGTEGTQVAETKVIMSSNITTIVQITVRSQSGASKVEYLYINKISTNIEIDVTLDSKEPDYYTDSTKTFTFLVDNEKEDFDLSVLAKSDYTMLEFEGNSYLASFGEIVHVDKTEEGKSFKVKATSESGAFCEYTIDIVRTSNDTGLDYLKVDDIERQPDEVGGSVYTVMIKKDQLDAKIEVMTSHPYASIRLRRQCKCQTV
ncbi:MAG: hypothetical protein K2H53_05385 [Clostridia bacterium]|nr:hypothetical protein [Clostridia bacterium]